MKKKTEYPMDPAFDWESKDFLKKSLRILKESETFGLYLEDKEGEHRDFSTELEQWIERWK